MLEGGRNMEASYRTKVLQANFSKWKLKHTNTHTPKCTLSLSYSGICNKVA